MALYVVGGHDESEPPKKPIEWHESRGPEGIIIGLVEQLG